MTIKHALQVGDTLEEFLVEATSDAKLRQTMMSLSEAVRTIAFKVRPRFAGKCTCLLKEMWSQCWRAA